MVIVPHSIEAEQALLGVLLGNPWLIDEAKGVIRTPDLFYRTSHAVIWLALDALGEAADETTIVEFARKKGALASCGGADALKAYVLESAYAAQHTSEYQPFFRIVRDCYQRREALFAAREIERMAAQDSAHGDDVVAEFNRAANKLVESGSDTPDVDTSRVIAGMEAEYEAGGTRGLTTAYQALDRVGGEFQFGGLYILAARPGQGKTALMCNILDRYRRADMPCGFFSLEMSGKQVLERLAGVRAGVDVRRLREGKLDSVERATAYEALRQVGAGALLCDRAGITAREIAARARVWKRKHKIQAIFVDYLQIVRAENQRLDRYLQIGEMTKALKQLARELEIVVIAACQINRGVERRASAKPTLADLKESGSIEEDADGVIMIYREKEPLPGDATWDAQIGWAKNRHGGVGHGKFRYERATTRFLEESEAHSQDVRRFFSGTTQDQRGGKD